MLMYINHTDKVPAVWAWEPPSDCHSPDGTKKHYMLH